MATRGAHALVGAVFFQIFYRTDRGWFFHNRNRCTPPEVGFLTYSSAVFCGRFSRFEILKKKINNKKIGLSNPISIYQLVQEVNTNSFFLFI